MKRKIKNNIIHFNNNKSKNTYVHLVLNVVIIHAKYFQVVRHNGPERAFWSAHTNKL